MLDDWDHVTTHSTAVCDARYVVNHLVVQSNRRAPGALLVSCCVFSISVKQCPLIFHFQGERCFLFFKILETILTVIAIVMLCLLNDIKEHRFDFAGSLL